MTVVSELGLCSQRSSLLGPGERKGGGWGGGGGGGGRERGERERGGERSINRTPLAIPNSMS